MVNEVVAHFNECPNCGGKISQKIVEKSVKWGKYSIKIDGIAADVCEKCHEMFFDIDDAIVMQKIVKSLSESLNPVIPNNDEGVLNLSETANFLRVSNQSVYNMIRDGRIKATKIGREWRFRKSEIITLMHAGESMPMAARNGREMSEHDKEILKKLQEEEE